MSEIAKTLAWMQSRKGKVTYSMSQRTGPSSYDCSSAVFYALAAGGFAKFDYPGNTDTLYGLEGKLLKPISRGEARKGDIFVSGKKGGSGGSAGHTGIFLANNEIIHCSYSKNGIAVTPANGWMGDYSGLPVHCYRLNGAAELPSTGEKPQMVILAVDGYWGPATTKRLQEYFGCAVRDGVISGQVKGKWNQAIPSMQFGRGGSMLVIAMQKWLGVAVDGNMGPGTITALQKQMGTTADGYISAPSDVVKELQRRLNKNKL